MPKVRMAGGKMKSYSYTPAGKKAAAKARKAATTSKTKSRLRPAANVFPMVRLAEPKTAGQGSELVHQKATPTVPDLPDR